MPITTPTTKRPRSQPVIVPIADSGRMSRTASDRIVSPTAMSRNTTVFLITMSRSYKRYFNTDDDDRHREQEYPDEQ